MVSNVNYILHSYSFIYLKPIFFQKLLKVAYKDVFNAA